MSSLDLLTYIATFALTIDVLLQIKHIYHTKSSRDISIIGLCIRFFAIIVLLFKFISLNDFPLVMGQLLIAVTFTAYFALAGVYFIHRRKK
jgi:uncharacterized protein with PQ loop repeat